MQIHYVSFSLKKLNLAGRQRHPSSTKNRFSISGALHQLPNVSRALKLIQHAGLDGELFFESIRNPVVLIGTGDVSNSISAMALPRLLLSHQAHQLVVVSKYVFHGVLGALLVWMGFASTSSASVF